jgi:tetratricopeptide (TPR) repeat protein
MTKTVIVSFSIWMAALSLPAASVASNAVPRAAAGTNSPVTVELEQLMEEDDATLDEVDKWIRDNNALAAKGSAEANDELNKRIHARLDTIGKRYQDFLKRHPDNADGHLAYGTFLNDTGDEDLAAAEYEISRKLAPTNPAAWNNLANYYGEHGPVTNAFAYYAKAIELNPSEPVYYQNFATTVYLFRKDAREFYGIDETQVFNKSLGLYQQAMRLDPTNFALATDYAESYYGIRPLRTNDALISWTNALKVAANEVEREAVHIHLARIKIAISRYDEAQAHLDAVTNALYNSLKQRLQRNLNKALHPETATNTVVAATNAVPATNAPPGK